MKIVAKVVRHGNRLSKIRAALGVGYNDHMHYRQSFFLFTMYRYNKQKSGLRAPRTSRGQANMK